MTSDMWILRSVNLGDPEKTFRILRGSVKTIGRATGADFILDAALVSRSWGMALATLEGTGPRRLTDLAVNEGVTQPSMTAVVTQLEDLGFAERRRDPGDGRVSAGGQGTAHGHRADRHRPHLAGLG